MRTELPSTISAIRSGRSRAMVLAMRSASAGSLLVTVTVVVLRFLLDDRSKAMIQSVDELRAIYPDIMVLAMIPDMREPEGKRCCFSCRSDRKNGKKEETGNA